jgi:hypothetical protein
MEKLWIDDPGNLFTKETWSRFVPTSCMDVPTAMNATVRFTVYTSLILYIAKRNTIYLLAIPLVLALTVIAVKFFPTVRALEAFSQRAKALAKDYTFPTSKNPFMNPLLTEILDNPNRHQAAPVTSNEVKRKIEQSFKQTSDLYMDTSDKFDLAQSMRTFHTVQSGLIPNDQDGFLEFLAKGIDEPDHSSAFPARKAKEKSEGYVVAQGSAAMTGLPNSTDKPTGVTPAGSATSLAK